MASVISLRLVLRKVFRLVTVCGLFSMTGCGAIIANMTSGFASDLSDAILNNNDPQLVSDAIPAYLVMIDAMVASSPKSHALLFSAADLNSSYASAFVEDSERRKALTEKAWGLAWRASCLKLKWTCSIQTMEQDAFEEGLARTGFKNVEPLYSLASNWIGWIEAHSDDWNALADLSRAKAVMVRVKQLDPSYGIGAAAMYLGVFETLLPPAFGGRPEVGRKHFEESIVISNASNLYAKVLFAEFYARMIFDQELHDKLLNEVLSANPVADGLTLMNRVAQIRAKALLDESNEFF